MSSSSSFRRALLSGALAFAAASSFAVSAHAQGYPNKPITLVVPAAAGGPTDTVARLIAESMSKTLGQTVVVDNTGGAGGTIGMARVARAAPDGYTIAVWHIAHSTAPSLYDDLKYNVVNDFDSIGRITGDSFNPVTFASTPSRLQTRISNLNYETRGTAHLVLWDGRLDQTLGFAYGSNILATLDPNNGNGRTSGDRVKLDWQGNVKLAEGHRLVLGAETARDALHRGFSFGFPTTLSQGITTNAGYAELVTDLPIGFHNSFSIRDDDNSRFGNRMTWRMAPSWVIESSGTTLRASAGSGFKAPALQQLFGPFGGNADLKPESSVGYEAGFDQKILGDNLVGGVTLFRNDIRNLITSGPAPTFQNVNIGRARTQGVETYMAWKALEGLTFRADYSYTDSIDGSTRAALLRRPRHKASLGADWQAMDDLQLNAILLYVGPQIDGNRDFSIPRRKQPDYVTMDLAASYRLTDTWSLFGRIENVTNTAYQSPDGFLRPGIGAYGGIKVNL